MLVCEIIKKDETYLFQCSSDKDEVVLKSSVHEHKETVFNDLNTFFKNGFKVSHIIDRTFDDGNVFYYLTCTNNLEFESPLKIEFEKEDGDYVGSIPDLNLFAYSPNIMEVIDDLKNDLDALYEELFIEKHKLSSKAVKIKEILTSKLMLNGV